MTTEIYLHEGDQESGRAFFAITTADGVRHVIFDVRNHTHHPDDPTPNGFRRWNPHKLYTGANTVRTVVDAGGIFQLYWDDFELWLHGAPPGVLEPRRSIQMLTTAVPRPEWTISPQAGQMSTDGDGQVFSDLDPNQAYIISVVSANDG